MAMKRYARLVAMTTAVLLVGLVGDVRLLNAESSHSLAAPTRFASARGGYEIRIPSDWHTVEWFEQDGMYRAVLSREEVPARDDSYSFGVSIARVADFKSVFKFASDRPSEMAGEFVRRLAQEPKSEGPNVVLAVDGRMHGMESFKYNIIAGAKETCSMRVVVVGIRGNDWLHEVWHLPCGEVSGGGEKLIRQVDDMADELTVYRKWGKAGG